MYDCCVRQLIKSEKPVLDNNEKNARPSRGDGGLYDDSHRKSESSTMNIVRSFKSSSPFTHIKKVIQQTPNYVQQRCQGNNLKKKYLTHFSISWTSSFDILQNQNPFFS